MLHLCEDSELITLKYTPYAKRTLWESMHSYIENLNLKKFRKYLKLQNCLKI